MMLGRLPGLLDWWLAQVQQSNVLKSKRRTLGERQGLGLPPVPRVQPLLSHVKALLHPSLDQGLLSALKRGKAAAADGVMGNTLQCAWC